MDIDAVMEFLKWDNRHGLPFFKTEGVHREVVRMLTATNRFAVVTDATPLEAFVSKVIYCEGQTWYPAVFMQRTRAGNLSLHKAVGVIKRVQILPKKKISLKPTHVLLYVDICDDEHAHPPVVISPACSPPPCIPVLPEPLSEPLPKPSPEPSPEPSPPPKAEVFTESLPEVEATKAPKEKKPRKKRKIDAVAIPTKTFVETYTMYQRIMIEDMIIHLCAERQKSAQGNPTPELERFVDWFFNLYVKRSQHPHPSEMDIPDFNKIAVVPFLQNIQHMFPEEWAVMWHVGMCACANEVD